jgi:hypothetical protein
MEDVDLDDPFTKVNSAIAIEKEIAADVIGGIFANTKERFLPYLEETALALKVLVEHYYEGIRKAAIQSLFTYIVTLNELSAPHPWVAGGTNVSISQTTTFIADCSGRSYRLIKMWRN